MNERDNPYGKFNNLKMYFLLNMGIFQCHVSFQGCRFWYFYWSSTAFIKKLEVGEAPK